MSILSRLQLFFVNLFRLGQLLIFLGVSSIAPSIGAQEDFFGSISVEIEEELDLDSDWSFTGWVRQKTNFGLQAPGQSFSRKDEDWSKIETSSYARWDYRINDNTAVRLSARASVDALYFIRDEDDYSLEEREEFKSRFELRDAYVETQFAKGHQTDNFYLKVGQQIVVWGEAENLRITDLVNTEDRFTFGQQDLEDIRLPVPALRLNYSFSDLLLDGVISYRAGSNDIAPAFDEFDPLISFRADGVTFVEQDPEQEHEIFVRLSGHYSRGDWGIAIAESNQDSFDIRTINGPLNGPATVFLGQDRFQSIGANINWTHGSWLAFAELGVHFDKRLQPSLDYLVQAQAQQQQSLWPETDQSLSALGLEYSGFRNTTISFEADTVHTHDHSDVLAVDRRQLGYSVRVLWNGFNERLQVLGVWNQLPDQGGRVGRFTLDYDWSDSIELGLMWVSYSANIGSPLYNYRHNDSIQFQFEYSFQH